MKAHIFSQTKTRDYLSSDETTKSRVTVLNDFVILYLSCLRSTYGTARCNDS